MTIIEKIQNSRKSDKYFNLLSSGMNHLWSNAKDIGIDRFVINTLEILMLIERDQLTGTHFPRLSILSNLLLFQHKLKEQLCLEVIHH